MKYVRCTTIVLVILFVTIMGEVEAQPMIGADVAVKAKYIWRGVPFNTESVLWPDVWINWYGATLTGWASIDLTDIKQESMEFTDIAIIADYTHTFGQISTSIGYLHYIYPGYAGAFPTTGEFYAALGAGFGAIGVALTGYYDLIEVNGLYVSPSISASYAFDYATPAITVSAGYAEGKHNNYYFGIDKAGFTDITTTLSAAITPPGRLGNFLSLGVDINYAKIIDGELAAQFPDNDVNFWWGIGLNFFYSFGGE